MTNSEKNFLAQIKKELDGSVDNLDGATRSRLTQIRTQALDLHTGKPSLHRTWLWAGGAALPALALGLMIFFGLPGQHSPEQQTATVASSRPEVTAPPFELAAIAPPNATIDGDELQILMSDEEMEMLADLDFLTWLSDQEEVGG